MALTEGEKKPDKKEKPLTKVIIRRLPPTMTKDQFLNQVSPLPDYNYMYHVRGDMSLGENAFSRAYINFLCPDDVYTFKEKFDNYVFVDSKGHEYTAVVEFAPFQKTPKRRGKNKSDPKNNTIELDPYFIEFVANLNKPIQQDAKPEYTLQLGDKDNDKKKDVSTPLLEFIKNRRVQKQRIREVRREEREKRKREFEKKKDDKKYDDGAALGKTYTKKLQVKLPKSEQKLKENEEKSSRGRKDDKHFADSKPREKKVEEKKEKKEIKPRFPKKECTENPKESFKNKQFDEIKREDGKKKVKKYSERREERKLEAKKAELKKMEEQYNDKEQSKTNMIDVDTKQDAEIVGKSVTKEEEVKLEKDVDSDEKLKDNEQGESSRRIRNKDRPALAIYRPGMLSKRRQTDPEDGAKAEDKPEIQKEEKTEC